MAKIGIDFGTTNTSVAAYDKKTGFEYFGSEGEKDKPTPSVAWYHDNQIDVGRKAKENYNKFCNVPGHRMVSSIKSKLGSGQQVSIFGKLTQPHEIASSIIKHMKRLVENSLASKGGIEHDSAVFTIPVNFTGKQRADLRKAANSAGIAVETFIHEPFAALIGYLYSNGVERDINAISNSYILVFDWGGGTLDITVINVDGTKMYEVGTSELSGIAGDKFDEALSMLVRNRFIDKYAQDFDLEYMHKMLDDKQDLILSVAEQCKIELSTKTETTFWVEDIIYDEFSKKSYDIDEKIKRQDFEACIKQHIDAAANCIEKSIRAARISHEQISFVLMTGGTSYIPLVKTIIENKFGSRVKTASNPDMVIAQGAAVVAEMGWTPYLSKNIMVELSDGSFWTAFQKGMPLVRGEMPSKSETFTCVDTRDCEAKLIIVESITINNKDRNLAVLNIPIMNPTTLQSADDVVAGFAINGDIVLTASGYGKRAGKRKTVEIHDICFGLEMG